MSLAKKLNLAQKVFNQYIRLRDTDAYGRGMCIASGEPVMYHSADAGHFIPVRFGSTRFDERNVNLQNRALNRSGDEFKESMAIRIDHKFGARTSQELRNLAQIDRKWMAHEVDEIIKKYRAKSRDLVKRKNFQINLY